MKHKNRLQIQDMQKKTKTKRARPATITMGIILVYCILTYNL